MDIDGDKKLDIIKNTLNGKTLFKFNSFSSDSQSLWETEFSKIDSLDGKNVISDLSAIVDLDGNGNGYN